MFYFYVFGKTFVTYSAIDYDDWNIELAGYLNEIRPDFQFHQEADCRLDVAEGAVHCAGKIEREVEQLQIFSEEGICAGEASISGGANNDFKIRELGFKLFDKCCGCINFAEANGVEPDAFFFWIFAGYFAESVGPACAVTFVPEHAIEDHRTYGGSCQQIYAVYDEFHSRSLKIEDIIISAGGSYVKYLSRQQVEDAVDRFKWCWKVLVAS